MPGFFDYLFTHLFGMKRGADIQKKAAPILVPLGAVAAAAVNTEIQSVISHNTAFAVQEISKGLDRVGLSGMDRTLVEAVVGGGLQHIHISLAPDSTVAPFAQSQEVAA